VTLKHNADNIGISANITNPAKLGARNGNAFNNPFFFIETPPVNQI
jgi:hypothetical protein